MDENEKQDIELKSLRDEFHSVASTHITFSQFTWIIGILMTMVVMAFGYMFTEIGAHDNEDDTRFAKIEEQHQNFISQNTSFQVTYAKIEVQLAQIQKDLLELKNNLTQHDRQ